MSMVPGMLKHICEDTGMGFAAIARVTDGTWTACAVQDNIAFGLRPGGQLKVETTLCTEVRAARAPIVINHASQDPVYRGHHTPRIYSIESYISVPIIKSNGDYFGNLCAIDPDPKVVSDARTVRMFSAFAAMIALQLENDDRYALAAREVADQRAAAELREQFIAVLGHDLRNPLAAVGTAGELLIRRPGEQDQKLGQRLRASTRRMAALIDNVMDFARTRLGSGIGVEIRSAEHLATVLREVVDEARAAHPGLDLRADIEINVPVACDPNRIQQLLSNLLGNAYHHGAQDQPVFVEARVVDGWLELSVRNAGDVIAPADLRKIFQPYWRPAHGKPGGGLGLGLYICSEIVKAHAGEFSATSTAADGTRFKVRIPLPKAGSDLGERGGDKESECS